MITTRKEPEVWEVLVRTNQDPEGETDTHCLSGVIDSDDPLLVLIASFRLAECKASVAAKALGRSDLLDRLLELLLPRPVVAQVEFLLKKKGQNCKAERRGCERTISWTMW